MKPNISAGLLSLVVLIGITSIVRADQRCPLSAAGSPLKHVVFLEFDNLHLERDAPNVPSDLEQMPHVFQFFTEHGLLSANHHTVQVSHTANGFLTAQAGVYSDRLGSGIANRFRRFNADGSTAPALLYAYWTASVAPGVPVFIDERGRNAPAPWPAFTRAGCDVAYVGIVGTVLENVTTDLAATFGPDSPEAQEGKADKVRAAADYEGVAIHCAKDSPLCAGPEAVIDRLPDQPGGYDGYKALLGNRNVAPRIVSALPLKDLDGKPIQDSNGHMGFPGFDKMLPNISLAYGAQFLAAGIPIVNIYVSDAHDNHDSPGTFGPGSSEYQAQLASYDRAFANFFARLKEGGIDETNTLFVFTADEGDHFVGSHPNPPDCDGVHTLCIYANTGVITVDIRRLVAHQRYNTTPFELDADMAPAIYIAGNPSQTDPVTRSLERDLLALTALNPLTGQTVPLGESAVDQAGMKFLHMTASDLARVPTFVFYQHEDFFGTGTSATTLEPCTASLPCINQDPTFAYNHGSFQEEIRTTWLGMAGPGVQPIGLTDTVWSDHVDLRPTILALATINGDYVHDGRVLIEFIQPEHLPPGAAKDKDQLLRLAAVYKEITAPFQTLGLRVLNVSTRALQGRDEEYAVYLHGLSALTAKRDELAGRIRAALDAALFQGRLDAAELRQLTDEAQHFLIEAKSQLR